MSIDFPNRDRTRENVYGPRGLIVPGLQDRWWKSEARFLGSIRSRRRSWLAIPRTGGRILRMPDHPACPLPKTHRRLADVYAIWHETPGSYPDPELSRRKLNSLLQETRNITWMLQAEKHVMSDFDAWYAPWRLRMAAIEVLKWALAMRNQVVKKGDLETRSIARVSVLAVWDNPPATEIDVPPMAGPAMIAQALTAAGVPQQLLKDAVAVVERRWIVDSLPDREVLDALAECYSVLHQLVG